MKNASYILSLTVIITTVFFMVGCKEEEQPMSTVESLDLERFMGDWHVIGLIPNFIEKSAVNGIEHYALEPDGSVGITYSFREKHANGKQKVMKAKGFIYNHDSKAEWRVQFIWPFKFPYLVVELDPDYSYTVIGVPNRKYAWIMSRKPSLDPDVYNGILTRMAAIGYDTSKIKKMPQVWQPKEM